MALTPTALVVLALVLMRALGETWLELLNRQNVIKHRGTVPEPLREEVNAETYAKSVAYSLAKIRLHLVEITYSITVLLLVLFTGVLPWAHGQAMALFGPGAASMAGFLLGFGLLYSTLSLPLDWYSQFKLEARFGFNTTTLRTWILDRIKGTALAILLGYPLLLLILKFVEWTGANWWVWAWASMLGFQLVIAVLAPVLIMPLFNKFSPLPEGSLRERLRALARKTSFTAPNIEVMDGSKRSRHSNAFFTGFGRFRKIVLFDTLIDQLTEAELEAVLAHEIGHFKRKHILKSLGLSAIASLGGFWFVGWLANRSPLLQAFGFDPGHIEAALLLFTLLSGTVTFWVSPFINWWSRKNEFEADSYAKSVVGSPSPLIGALRKLNEKNLSNLTPHPLYSCFHYSHPPFLEREAALKAG